MRRTPTKLLILLGLAVVVMLAAISVGCTDSHSLAGRWELESTEGVDRYRVAHAIELLSDETGTVDRNMPINWTLEGDRLTIANVRGTMTHVYTIQLSEDLLIFYYDESHGISSGASATYRRVQ